MTLVYFIFCFLFFSNQKPLTIAGVDGFFYAEKFARLQIVSYICDELSSSIFRFLMMYNLLLSPTPKKSGIFFCCFT